MSSKVALDNEGLARMMVKVKAGLCCLQGCERSSELMYMSSSPPYLCDFHIENPSDDAHPGEYISSDEGSYRTQASHKWTCCGGTWRLGRCSVLAQAFVASEIPVSERQRERLAEKEREAEEAWKERERQEAIAMASDNYCWDRS